ncbi:MAG TPA: SDR family oxidoreductase [Ilumatobacteraceae bacterium]|nr:SDR family oxidoreductase [Ilumatobacteraceae bacterium]
MTDSSLPTNSTRDLAGRVVIVTGAARGLGRDYARLLAADGAKVAIADVRADAVAATADELVRSVPSADVVAITVDVTDPASTSALAAAVVARWGTIDVLINNAGIWGDLEPAPLWATDPAYFDRVLAVNLRGPLLCAQAVVGAMREQGWGRIINISSMGAYMPSGVYGVSKLGLNQMTFTLATELGPDGITVNAVAPGPIDNEATRSQVAEAGITKMIAGTALKRMGTAADLYGMIRYLASTDADWVTGQTFLVNGGYNSRL